jgi:hypothetical protein
MNRTHLYVITAAALSALMFFIYFPLASSQPFGYDDADYMWAGKQGLWANYTDRNGLSFVEFVSRGLDLYRNPSKRAEFSRFIRESGDVGAYRHYHGPMYAYWLAFLAGAGATREEVFRGAGLFIHIGTAALILFGFWKVFPDLPRIAGLAGCALFLFNRTALAAGMIITQHVLFAFWVVATLFAASMFFRKYESRWLYATVALLAAGAATVETTAIAAASLVIALAADYRRGRERWPSLRSLTAEVVKVAGVFIFALLVVWPKGVVQGGIIKGFLQQGYMAIARKSFSPVSPLGLWRSLFAASPWEFGLLLCGTAAGVILWRRSRYSRELLPWLAYVAMFLLATLKVTAPFTYYFAPLTAAAIVVTAFAFGTAWQRSGAPVRIALSIAIVVSIVATGAEWARVSREARDAYSYYRAALDTVRAARVEPGKAFYVPFQLVPTLHYYHPEVSTVAMDYGYSVPDMVAGLRSPSAASALMCEKSMCDEIQSVGVDIVEARNLVHPQGPTGQPLYVLRLRKGGG